MVSNFVFCVMLIARFESKFHVQLIVQQQDRSLTSRMLLAHLRLLILDFWQSFHEDLAICVSTSEFLCLSCGFQHDLSIRAFKYEKIVACVGHLCTKVVDPSCMRVQSSVCIGSSNGARLCKPTRLIPTQKVSYIIITLAIILFKSPSLSHMC